MSIRFQIDRSGNFDPSTQQDARVGDGVSFVLAEGASFGSVYVFSGSPLAPDATLFGTTSVRTANEATIQSSAVVNRTYTLSVSATAVKDGQTGIKNGTIKVGS